MKKRAPLLTDVWTAQVGAPTELRQIHHPTFAPQLFEFYGKLGASAEFTETRDMMNGGKALVIREPVGVVAIITPWNAPMCLISYGVAAALTAGCTIVAKPAPETPLEGAAPRRMREAVGLPAGVLNIVPAGREVGDYLINRPEIDKVSFTGSVAGGKRIAEVCAKRLARYTLELGGKSPAVDHGRRRSIDCDRHHRAVFDADDRSDLLFADPGVGFEKAPRRSRRRLQAGGREHRRRRSMEDGNANGPAFYETATRSRHGLYRKGPKGGRHTCHRRRPAQRHESRLLRRAHDLFSNVNSDMTIAKEEIFGPVVSVMPYENEEDAIRIANNSTYGLSGAVFTKDPEKGLALAKRIRTGNVTVNGLNLQINASIRRL